MLISVIVALAGCALPADTASPANGSVALPSAETLPRPTPDPSQVAEWTAFREAFGLQADPDWISIVAANPASENDTGIPLLPSELDALGAAIRSTRSLVEALTWYGERYPDEFAGVSTRGRTVVLYMAGDADAHQARLRRLFPGSSQFEVRQVERSRKELQALAQLVSDEADWFETIGAYLVEAHPSLEEVRVTFRAAHEEIGAKISNHFGRPEWLRVEWEGPLAWEGPLGAMVVSVRDQRGHPVVGAQCSWDPIDPSIDADSALAFSTKEDGVCRNDYLPAVAFTVIIRTQIEGQGLVEIGRASGVVPAGGVGFTDVTTKP